MAEIDDFRFRLRNWARVYRDRFIRQESNIMLVIRALRRIHKCLEEATEPPQSPPDYFDAEEIDTLITRVRHRGGFEESFRVLKAEYLTRFSVDDYECDADYKEARKHRARYARVFARDYDDILYHAEQTLMMANSQKFYLDTI